ncbi:MAG: primosomal protein N' [Burkholderiales bacterium]|nr:primosomal protein N' [Burkholderiales bacterium]
MAVLRVALDVPLPTLFDYLPDPGVDASVGDRVVVPFGTRHRIGVVIEQGADTALPPEKLRSIEGVLDDAPRLDGQWLALMQFLAGYYQRPLGETVVASLPPRLRALRPLPRVSNPVYRLSASAPAERPRGPRQQALLDALRDGPLAEDALLGTDPKARALARPALRRLLESGWVESAPAVSDDAWGTRLVCEHSLNDEQTAACDGIRAALGRYEAFLLHGVTGSGKTEIYLHLIAEVLARGAQALVLVPEISLTPQLEARFRRAFPETSLVVMHSGLEESTRTAAWIAAARGKAAIVLGTRLAALAPMPGLGLVVIDEEHDTSFKQQEGLRYSGRDAAVYRARLAGCPVVLGTATPALETWFNSEAGRYRRITLSARAAPGAVLPRVRMLDLAREPLEHGIAQTMLAAIEARLARGEQSLVFINRRGYAPVLACPACGWAAGCTRCTAHLVLHATDRRLHCHHCGAEEPVPRACPVCGNVDLRPLGRGTQRVEETLAARFPSARIARIDRDTARRRETLTRTLEAIARGAADILVGTQLLAKGHDFPGLTLVGVLNADTALLSTDYRAAERLFATLAQVAGRAGRRERPGEVMVQTRYPRHALFDALARHDYAGFAVSQLDERRTAGFPPYVSEAVLRAEAPRLDTAMTFLRFALEQAGAPAEVVVYDPVPQLLTRRAGLERAKLLVQSASRTRLQSFLGAWSAQLIAAPAPLARRVRWHLDVDPIEFD